MPPLALTCIVDISNNTATAFPDDYPVFLHSTLPILPESVKKPWSTSKSASLYKVDGWGAPYFFINAQGHMAIRPSGHDTKPHEEIDIMNVVQRIIESRVLGDLALPFPLVLRFPDILKHRLEKLQSAFDSAIRAHQYQGQFQGVFPVKCNQDRFVVESIVKFGRPYGFGLEAGSKPELLLAMAALCKGNTDALLVCNGYKDADYVCLALMAKQLQLNCVIVLEQEQELDVVLNISQHLGIEPMLGLRAKLNTKHGGHFGETSGEDGKFGLSCTQIVRIVQKLQKTGKLTCLQLLHFHIGSQIPSLAILNDGVSEAAHIYCELDLMGANMQFLDIGGGLGVDYDGTGSAKSDMSVGYTMEGYAKEVVQAVKSACTMKGVKQPTLCSESGRALVSHHSVLVFDVLSAHHKGSTTERDKGVPLEVNGTLPEELSSLHRSLTRFAQAGDYERTLECANKLKMDCTKWFKKGTLSLAQLAAINSLYEVLSAFQEQKSQSTASISPTLSDPVPFHRHDDSSNGGSYSAIYHINLSIFRSMPDTWAIGQLFPIVPLHQLQEEPTVKAILSDLTCDSDGKITTFAGTDARGNRMNHLRVHPLQDGKPYYMGMFLGGAYQEALGSMHNMFGAPAVVHVIQCRRGGRGGDDVAMKKFKIMKVSDGQKVADVLGCMQYNHRAMLEALTLRMRKCLKECGPGEEDRESAMAVMSDALACTFGSSTYLSTNHPSSSIFTNLFQPHVMG